MALTIDAAIREAAMRLSRSETPLLDARVLMQAALGASEADLIARARDALSPEDAARFDAMVARRAAHEPVAYILEKKEFWSLDLAMTPGVLIPRADSETLIEAVRARRAPRAGLRILDLGVGSGALLCALLFEFADATGLGVDIDPLAVALAARNLDRLGFAKRARAVEGDWTRGLVGPFDIIVSNPPYIAEGDREALAPDVRDFESPRALFAGPDGLDAYRTILPQAKDILAPDGLVIVEIGAGQVGAVMALAGAIWPDARPGLAQDLAGRGRAVAIDLKREKN
jgi:release factor glutamine methyltransferase